MSGFAPYNKWRYFYRKFVAAVGLVREMQYVPVQRMRDAVIRVTHTAIRTFCAAMKQPDFTIIFPTFNRPRDVVTTLSRLQRNITVEYEVIVLDNSPQPMSLKLRNNEHYHFLGRNAGTAARNIGIQHARAPYILMLDDDSHPLPNSLELTLDKLRKSPDHIAGLIGNIQSPDGSRRSSLLPTVFHGCGVAFKTDIIQNIKGGYPENFCFYGEEYWLTLLLYKKGYRLIHGDELKIMHRLSKKERSIAKIFYYLVRNNAILWDKFVPDQYLEKVNFDTNRRYELIAKKEGVIDAYEDGRNDALRARGKKKKLTKKQFMDFSFISRFQDVLKRCNSFSKVVLCGCGKFPNLWANHLRSNGVKDVVISDFNSGLIGQSYGDYEVLPPKKVLKLEKQGFKLITGHTSSTDTDRWNAYLFRNLVTADSLMPVG